MLDGRDVCFIAGRVGEGPPCGGELVPDHASARRECSGDTSRRLVVRYPDGDMDGATAILARLLHLFEPERRSAIVRIDEIFRGAVTARLIAKHRLPERHHRRNRERAGDVADSLHEARTTALEGRDPEIGEQAVRKLLEAVDAYIPTPERPVDQPFLMPVEDVFSISGRGTVVTGRIERGVIKVGEEIEIVGIRATQKTTVTGVEMFRKLLDQGQAGDKAWPLNTSDAAAEGSRRDPRGRRLLKKQKNKTQ